MNTLQPCVWVVEDEPVIAELLVDYLRHAGYAAEHFPDGSLLVERLRQGPPDLLLLDLMLPGRDGLSLCREIRSFSSVPIMLVTAKVEELDRILGLETGADDYVCKPFSPREVVARVRALLRRVRPDNETPAAHPHIQVDEAAHRIKVWHGETVQVLDLTETEYRLMCALVCRPGTILTRAQLIAHVHAHGEEANVFDRAIDSHIKNLRRKVAAVLPQPCIHSIYGVGYRFELGDGVGA